MLKFKYLMLPLLLSGGGASGTETPGELTQTLRDDIEKRIVQELSKEGHSREIESAVQAALYLVVVDLNKGLPRTLPVVLKMLENENRKVTP